MRGRGSLSQVTAGGCSARRTALALGATMTAVPASAEQDREDPSERQRSRRPAAVANATAAARGCAAARHARRPARVRTTAEAAASAPARSGEDNPAAHAAVDRSATRGARGSRAAADGLELQPIVRDRCAVVRRLRLDGRRDRRAWWCGLLARPLAVLVDRLRRAVRRGRLAKGCSRCSLIKSDASQ